MSKSKDTSDNDTDTEVLSPSELEQVRAALLSKRESLTDAQQTQLRTLSDPSDKHHLADLEELASDTLEVDSLCEIMGIEELTVAQIDAALEKIDLGTYGICAACEEPIPRVRLDALPFAGLCIECQRKKESEPTE